MPINSRHRLCCFNSNYRSTSLPFLIWAFNPRKSTKTKGTFVYTPRVSRQMKCYGKTRTIVQGENERWLGKHDFVSCVCLGYLNKHHPPFSCKTWDKFHVIADVKLIQLESYVYSEVKETFQLISGTFWHFSEKLMLR